MMRLHANAVRDRGVLAATSILVAACTHGAPPTPPPTGTILVDDVDATGLAIDQTFLYWASPDGSVMKAPLEGSSGAITLASGISTRPIHVGVDATFVYWTTIGSLTAKPPDGGLSAVSLSGGTPVTLATGYQADPIAVTDGFVYWGDCGAVRRVSKSQGVVETVYDSGDCFLSEVDAIAVDATFVYWNANGPQRKPLVGGGSPTTWSSGASGTLAVDTNNVYWTEGPFPCDVLPCHPSGPSSVWMAPLTGGAPTMLATFTTASFPAAPIAIDATHVYWTTADSVQRVPLTGGAKSAFMTARVHALALLAGCAPAPIEWKAGEGCAEARVAREARRHLLRLRRVGGLAITLVAGPRRRLGRAHRFRLLPSDPVSSEVACERDGSHHQLAR